MSKCQFYCLIFCHFFNSYASNDCFQISAAPCFQPYRFKNQVLKYNLQRRINTSKKIINIKILNSIYTAKKLTKNK